MTNTKTDSLTVWVTEHDDPEVGFVVNEREDMRENWEDLREAGIDGGLPFEEYLDTWVELEMPRSIFEAEDANERIVWVEEHLELLR